MEIFQTSELSWRSNTVVGCMIMQIGVLPSLWQTVFAPIAMTLMFLFVSVPLMENYMKEKCPGYEEYKKRVSVFIPMPEKKNNN